MVNTRSWLLKGTPGKKKHTKHKVETAKLFFLYFTWQWCELDSLDLEVIVIVDNVKNK